MKTIVLVTCVKEKAEKPCSAQDMYIGDLFLELMDYAQEQKPDKIFILSGKYGLLELEQEIAPYDVNLNEVSDEKLSDWSITVLDKLRQHADLKKDKFILLCNPTYAKYLKLELQHYSMPIIIQ